MKYCHSESIVQLKVTDDITVNIQIILLLNIIKLKLFSIVIVY